MSLAPADAAFAEALAARLPLGCLRPAAARDLDEPRGRVTGQGAFVAAPRTTSEVAEIVRACAEARVGIVPRAGGTGLVVGSVMPEGPAPLILSVERMTAVRGLWRDERVASVEAGVVLADLQAAAEAAGLMFPLSLASGGSARVGGLLATNAGGVHVLRHGTMRDLCLGAEAVLADGSIVNSLGRLRKDNTGYDVRNLLVGSEGTLAILTAATLRLAPRPASMAVALLQVESPAAALALLHRAEARLGGGLLAFELISGQGLAFLAETMPHLRQPWPAPPDWLVLIEAGLPEGAEEALAHLYAEADTAGLARDGRLSQSAAQAEAFWRLREAIPEANRRIGAIASHDISLPLSEVPGFLGEVPALVAPFGPLRLNAFGHLGDGNLHVNLFPPRGEDRAAWLAHAGAIQRAIHDRVQALGGSFSAEHGIGRLKAGELARRADPGRLAAMRAIKAALDPLGILNPGAVLEGS